MDSKEKSVAGKQQRNRRNAIAFYDLMFNQSKPREAVDRFVGDDYRQHNPFGADGKEAFVEYFDSGWRMTTLASTRRSSGPSPMAIT